MLTPENSLITAIGALIAGIAAWLAKGAQVSKKEVEGTSLETLVSNAVTRQYHLLVTEVAELRLEVANLARDVADRDLRIDELEADKRLASHRIEELEREVNELRLELSKYQPTRRKRATQPEEGA